MQEFTFPAWCSFGTEYTYVDVELSDRDAKKLIRYGTKSDVFYGGFADCEELSTIYKKVYKIAVEQMTEEIRESGDLDEKYAEDDTWRADKLYTCGVDFPEEFEDMLENEEE